ncbi:hypothetical protein CgunFtcFv8_018397 [Champsocephalus gunnari]|uniref:Uncharacterized protein n=1 Tax=Champsocephalus gunnari TaxID=52237 RepID=A0AAN8BVM3_CHAGU|nr:hypothetical protein CgunFtcFv8_018397 [Champsocephalus gunnari]
MPEGACSSDENTAVLLLSGQLKEEGLRRHGYVASSPISNTAAGSPTVAGGKFTQEFKYPTYDQTLTLSRWPKRRRYPSSHHPASLPILRTTNDISWNTRRLGSVGETLTGNGIFTVAPPERPPPSMSPDFSYPELSTLNEMSMSSGPHLGLGVIVARFPAQLLWGRMK